MTATKAKTINFRLWFDIGIAIFIIVAASVLYSAYQGILSMGKEQIIAKQERMHMAVDIAENKKARKETSKNIQGIKLSLVRAESELKYINKSIKDLKDTFNNNFAPLLQKNRSVEIETDPSKVDEVNLCDVL